MCFNSQPRKGADNPLGLFRDFHKGFNSQPRKGADCHRDSLSSQGCVSTHSPARGLTNCSIKNLRNVDVSTHSPARGLTAILHNFRIFPMHVSVLIALNHSFIHIAPDIFLQYRPVFTVRMFRDISVYLYFAL